MSGSHFAVLRGFVLSALLHACVGTSRTLTINVIPSKPKTGDTVTLSVTGVDGTIIFASWYKGQGTSAKDQILTHLGGEDKKGEKYITGAVGIQNGSLVIPNFQEEYNGDYTVQIQTNKVLQDGKVTVNGVGTAVLCPFTILLGLLLYSSVSNL